MVERLARENDEIVVSDLSIYYPAHGGSAEHQAVEGVSFSVPRGSVYGLLGESGSGKSTLARVLAARADEGNSRVSPIVNSGVATVLGEDVVKLSKKKRNQLTADIGFLSQSAGATLPPDRTVADVILEPIVERTKKFDRKAVGLVIAEMMDLLALPLTMLNNYPHELSKGQRQRIAVMRAMVMQPKILVADEPTLGVDVANRPRIINLLAHFREKNEMTLLLVSHDIAVLEHLVEELIVLQEGSLVGRGTIEDVFSAADHGYVRRLADALRATAYDELSTD
ncbi:ATP-binding cassette domain-containing protein [Klugiella xanthotipulae]|uniref:ABC-type dipeptide/oligopeptide/nickel transport system ATPase component n=1 Tax=Klugiella xanthotipulae TaxID=244735 RepID=A0A543HSG0_9MICO|nr:dipeptide/oligopeptide/nickel ABC transporter ATP-binding protein [Klugiella xanthotipulae]TQM61275.1 ABC-type dipeptide/oligopeptide/nickel transport system ATPase component [Klugiella xanthotipulae]